MADDFNPQEFKRRLKEQLKASREAFDGKYKDQLAQLSGLSGEELNRIMPAGADMQQYDALIAVVKEASRTNLSEAELVGHIKELGETAVKIAKNCSTLAVLL